MVVQELHEARVVELRRNAGDLVTFVREGLPEGLGVLAGVVLLQNAGNSPGYGGKEHDGAGVGGGGRKNVRCLLLDPAELCKGSIEFIFHSSCCSTRLDHTHHTTKHA